MNRRLAAIALVMACLASIRPTMGETEWKVYKLKLSGNWWRGKPWTGIVVEQSQNTLKIRYTEQGSTFGALDGRWFDAPATAIKACIGNADSFDTTECVTSTGDTIELPQGASAENYVFDFKHRTRNGDSVIQKTFSFRELEKEK